MVEDNIVTARTPGHTTRDLRDLPDAADPNLVRLLAEVCRSGRIFSPVVYELDEPPLFTCGVRQSSEGRAKPAESYMELCAVQKKSKKSFVVDARNRRRNRDR